MRPIIGVIPLFDEKKDSIWMVPGYMTGIEEAGGLPIILPYTSDDEELLQAAELCDGFLLTGGHDIGPAIYGQEKHLKFGRECPIRDDMESMLFQYAWEKDKAVFGICRGIQLINVVCGGTLYQDLPSEFGKKIEHRMTAPYDKVQHSVTIEKKSLLYDWFGCNQIGVNSYHHQGVRMLGDGLEVMARSEDGLVEAVSMPGKRFVVAVQWHPEFNYKKDVTSVILFRKFVESCSK